MKSGTKNKLSKTTLMWESVMGNWTGVGGAPDPGAGGSGHPIADVLTRALMWLLGIFGLLAIICFVVAGVLYLSAQGDPTRIEKAKKATIYGVIGVVVGLIGLVVIRTIEKLLRG
jgi:hypothetical protein